MKLDESKGHNDIELKVNKSIEILCEEDKPPEYLGCSSECSAEVKMDKDEVNRIEQAQNKRKEHEIEQLDLRNKKYSDLLIEYIDEYKDRKPINRRYKTIFFYTFIGILSAIVISTVWLTISSIFNINNIISTQLIISLITSSITMITSIIAIPKIIAKYLFAIEEDKVMAEIVKAMLTQDDFIREKLNLDMNKK